MIIGIIGAKYSGKSTVGRYIEGRLDYCRLSLASPIKAMLALAGLSKEQLDGAFKETKTSLLCNQTPRHAMQTLGTEWGRKLIGDDFWLNIWMQETKQYANVVVDDVRFPNEVARIKELSGIILKIRRPEVEGSSAHESELYATSMDCDIEIFNIGTIPELFYKVDDFIVDLKQLTKES